jgi:hypothetical protein
MKIPVIEGIIDRRILVNFRIDPQILKGILPSPFVPKIVNGFAMGGICLIRLKNIRPRFLGKGIGISSENAAHRFAVEWKDQEKVKEGVFIPRRDTSSYLNSLVGGRLFPGVHHHAKFQVQEKGDNFFVAINSFDKKANVLVDATISGKISESSVFNSIKECSNFFEKGSLGYSPTKSLKKFDGLELKVNNWVVEPLLVHKVESSYFLDDSVFPKGSVTFDCALLMRNIQHEWHSREELCCAIT